MLLFERRTKEFDIPSERPAGVSDVLAALLHARGAHDAASMEAFLNPCDAPLLDPYVINDMDKAVSRIREAISNHERICVYGDYDADGVCATSILFLCLKKLGAEVCFHIPNRHSEGYGMNCDAVKKLADDNVKLIITVDNGVKSVEETKLASSLNMDVIVTDHHRCGDSMPKCTALVCTAIPESLCMDLELCGAGIALKLAQALTGFEPEEDQLVLAGLATVADVVPLLGENRSLVAHAIRIVNKGGGPVGLRALMEAANAKRADARTFAYLLAPRLNAAGRLDDATLSVELLTSADEDHARGIAQQLDALNARRKKEEQSIMELACEMAEGISLTTRRGIILKSDTWNSGVVGIAAARIAERYYRPTVLFSERDGLLTGSARSILGVDLHAALKRCESLFVRFGGHAYAAGVTMEAKNLAAFEEAFEEALRETADDSSFLPKKSYELEIPFREVSLKLAKEIERLEPFGEGNAEPLFRVDNIRIRNLKRIGNEGAHLSLTAEYEGAYANAVGFFMGDKFSLALDADKADILFTPKSDAFFGEPALKLHLSELRPSRIENAETYIEARSDKFIDAISRNVRYNKNCGFRVQVVSNAFETAANEAVKHFAGVAALCFTPKGAAHFLRFLHERDLLDRFDARFITPDKSACAYHTLLLAPDLTQSDLSRYQSIVVCDSPLFTGMLARLNELAPSANIYVAPPVVEDVEQLLTSVRLDRGFMAKVFRAFKATDRAFYNRSAALDALSSATGERRSKCSLALDVMLELDFASENKLGNIELRKNPKPRELIESETFQATEAILEDHEAYKEELDHGA